MIAVPAFDTDAIRQWAEYAPPYNKDKDAFELSAGVCRQIVADLNAAADHIELLTAALEQARRAA